MPTPPAMLKSSWRKWAFILCVVSTAGVAASLAIRLAYVQADNRVLASDNRLQGQVIATQAFNFTRFNQVALETGRLNSLIDDHTENTITEYREILRHEKTCDQPVPDDIAGGLLGYAHRLRASAMHADTVRPDATDDHTAAPGSLTYCQAVLWIKPLLAVIEAGNNSFAGIRDIEQ
ncbi:hypothetical protein ACX43S_25320 [Enterobacter cloacae]